MADWKAEASATRVAPRVFRSGEGQYVVLPTPYGKVELIAVKSGFVVAAERPPDDSLLDPRNLPDMLANHFRDNGLHPWKQIGSTDLHEVILKLQPDCEDDAPARPAWSPFLCLMETGVEVVGEARRFASRQIKGILDARRPREPVPQISGVPGVGRRTLAACVAQSLSLHPVELPISRCLIERTMQQPMETVLDTLMAGADALRPDELLVVSEAEWIHALELARRVVLAELSRLPRVLLVGAPVPQTWTDGVIVQECLGLESADDVEALIKANSMEVQFAGPALNLLMRTAAVEGVGVVPGRLLFLVRLAMSVSTCSPLITPDDAAHAAELGKTAWREAVHS